MERNDGRFVPDTENKSAGSPEKIDFSRFGKLSITDHPDDPGLTRRELVDRYSALSETQIRSVRYDWRWGRIQPKRGEFDRRQLNHYKTVKEVMDEAGLEAPTVILSTPPVWALDMYKDGYKEGFYNAFRDYAIEVKKSLDETEKAGREKVTRFQILNELNNKVFTPIMPDDIPQMCEIAREVFGEDVKLVATVLAMNHPLGTPVKDFLDQNGEMLRQNFDVIGVDYYPGIWHLPVREAVKETSQVWTRSLPRMQMPERGSFFRALSGNTTLLRSVYATLSGWGVDYELAEVGRPTKKVLGGEEYQAMFFETFFGAYGKMIEDMEAKGQKLPSGGDLYCLRDESSDTVLKFVPGLREKKWGLQRSDGTPKKSASLFRS